MHTADAPGREDRDPGKVRGAHRRTDRRRGEGAGGEQRTDVARARLRDRAVRVRQLLEQLTAGADDEPAALQRRRRRNCAGVAHRRLGRERRLEVVGNGQALRDQAGLERHHRSALGQGCADLVRDEQRCTAHGSPATRVWAPTTPVTAVASSAAAIMALRIGATAGGHP